MPEETRLEGAEERDQRKEENAPKLDRRTRVDKRQEELSSLLSPDVPMSMRLRTEPGSSADAVRFYVECVCKSCSRSFRFDLPIPHGQNRPGSCHNCGAPFSKEDALHLLVFVDYMTASLFGGKDDRPVYLTGTCANCLSRLRFDAREVCDLETIYCPHCGFELGEDGKAKIIDQARKLLGMTKG